MTRSSSSQMLSSKLGGRNLYLIGMMGCGKSSTGPHLAEGLSYGFVDSDKVIEQACSKSIAMIFDNDGEEAFRSLESQVLNAIGQRHSLVVATGGGIVTKSENWGVLHQGIVVWIDPGIERLFARLKSDSGGRPLFKNNFSFHKFEDLCLAREKFYVEADLHLKVFDKNAAEVAKQILTELPSILSSPEDLIGPQTISPSPQA